MIIDIEENVEAFCGWYREQGNRIAWEDCDTARYDSSIVEADGSEYLVLTDDEADQRWDDYLENYLDECVLPELPDNAQHYFDREAWKSDARHDGRGHCLSSYDGCEHEYQDKDGNYWYIYRIN